MSTRRLVDYLVVVGCTETDNLREYLEKVHGPRQVGSGSNARKGIV